MSAVQGRREGDARPVWPMYVTAIIALLAVVWSAAINVANAAATERNVVQMQTQLNSMQANTSSLREAIAVLNCKVGISCKIDGP